MVKDLSKIPFGKNEREHLEGDALYRVMPFAQLMEMLLSGKNTLLHPSCWEDPFEHLMKDFKVKISDGSINKTKLDWNRWYGQCWSTKSESDGLWRVFTHNKEVRSVKVKTNIKKLKDSCSNIRDVEFYVGDVIYAADKNFAVTAQQLTDHYLIEEGIKEEAGPNEIKHLWETALLTFDYEHEYRLLAYINESSKAKSWAYETDVKSMIEEIEFDPWTKEYEQPFYRTLLSDKFGITENVTFSSLYKKPEGKNSLNIYRRY